MIQKARSTFVLVHPNEILQALVGLKDVWVVHYERRGPNVTLMVEHHLARVSNGPTAALDNLIKRIKRIAFGFRNFENYRIRAVLYGGRFPIRPIIQRPTAGRRRDWCC